MAHIVLRPEIKTAGGEVNEIVVNGRFAGMMTLVYRENDRISGSVQLEEELLSGQDKEQLDAYVHQVVQDYIHALGAVSCDVIVTYSRFDHIVSTDDDDWLTDDPQLADEPEAEWDSFQMEFHRFDDPAEESEEEKEGRMPGFFELVVTDEGRSRIEYAVFDQSKRVLARADIRLNEHLVSGDIDWSVEPDDEEIEQVTELIVSDFDEEEIDMFVLNHFHEGEFLETIELTHEDLLEEDDELFSETASQEDDYTIVLARDDRDTLTYEIYQQSKGGLPVGTATIDTSSHECSGFIDFRDPGNMEDHEAIGTRLLQELDKEKDYRSVNLTMLYQNKPFDEIMYELDRLH